MVRELNMHFSSVFTREDACTRNNCIGTEGDKLGQLVVTPEVVAININIMKDYKSPVVDGMAPKILK